MQAFLILSLQAAVVIALVLLLFRLRPTFGLAPLYVCLGVFQVLQTLLSTVFVEVAPGLLVSPGSAILFTASLCAVLLVYIREDALEARKLIYALVISNVATSFLSAATAYQLRTGAASSLTSMPAEAFIEAAGMLVFGSLLLYADALLIPLVYELSAGRLRSLMAGMIVTMTVVLAFDTLVFVSVFFWNATNYLVLLRSALVGKVFFASCFCVLMALYLRLLEREPLPAANGPGVRDLFAMLTYRQKFELLSAAAARDALTGVFNRGHFDQALGHECLRAERAGLPLSVVLADVDYFKAFNDRYGHPEGDRCLKAVASALDGARRPFDMTARYGGEEFAVLLPSTGLAGAMTVAEALRGAVAALNLRHEEHPLGLVTVSMGVGAIAPGESVDCTELIDRADRALYRAKAAGRNRVEAS